MMPNHTHVCHHELYVFYPHALYTVCPLQSLSYALLEGGMEKMPRELVNRVCVCVCVLCDVCDDCVLCDVCDV